MNTDHPTVELYFVFAFTYCKLRVYKEDERFAREVLQHAGAREYSKFDTSESESWQEVDTRVLLSLTRSALPKMVGQRMEGALTC